MLSRLWKAAVVFGAIVCVAGCSNSEYVSIPGSGSFPSAVASTASPGTPSPTPAPVTATPAPTVAAGSVALPATCESLYSPEYFQTLSATQDFGLNPGWTATPGAASLGTKNAVLLPLLQGRQRLDCFWAPPTGGGEEGLTTSVSALAPSEQPTLLASLTDQGYSCAEQTAGTKCVLVRTDATASGETQFVGGDYWIATSYVGFAPVGYTDDIVSTLLG